MSAPRTSLFHRVRQRRGVRQFVKFGIVGASGFVVNLVIFTLLQRVVPNHTGGRAVLRDLLDRVSRRRRLELFPQPHLDVPFDRACRQGGRAVPERLGAGAASSAWSSPRSSRRALGHGHKTWFVRDAVRHRRQLLRQQVLDVPVGRVSRGAAFLDRGRSRSRRSARCCASKASTTRSSTIPAGAKATPPRSRATSRNCSTTRCFRRPTTTGRRRTTSSSSCRSCRFWPRRCTSSFGVHEVFGRLISLAFGVATIPVRRRCSAAGCSRSAVAGVAAAAAFAILPGAWYYSHTFMPDTAMVFFTTCALFACAAGSVDARGCAARVARAGGPRRCCWRSRSSPSPSR